MPTQETQDNAAQPGNVMETLVATVREDPTREWTPEEIAASLDIAERTAVVLLAAAVASGDACRVAPGVYAGAPAKDVDARRAERPTGDVAGALGRLTAEIDMFLTSVSLLYTAVTDADDPAAVVEGIEETIAAMVLGRNLLVAGQRRIETDGDEATTRRTPVALRPI